MDVLKFIDSPDIRKFNENAKFTPAEQAVLISKSVKATVEEKIEALKYLTEHYNADEFGDERVYSANTGGTLDDTFRETVIRTIRVWEKTLQDRNNPTGVIYAAQLLEVGFPTTNWNEYKYFSDYEMAWNYLKEIKQSFWMMNI